MRPSRTAYRGWQQHGSTPAPVPLPPNTPAASAPARVAPKPAPAQVPVPVVPTPAPRPTMSVSAQLAWYRSILRPQPQPFWPTAKATVGLALRCLGAALALAALVLAVRAVCRP